MQLLGMGSQESPNIRGLSLIEGNSFKFNAEFGERIPNVGWDQV
jgi:imidazoleglycerol phosphate synthase glutamine amidotransferase subunit HisH